MAFFPRLGHWQHLWDSRPIPEWPSKKEVVGGPAVAPMTRSDDPDLRPMIRKGRRFTMALQLGRRWLLLPRKHTRCRVQTVENGKK
jgi:hypothetical protein